MHKLKLDLDTLQVESFETARSMDARGSVQAHEVSFAATCACNSIGCPATYTCDGTDGPGCANNPWTTIAW